MTVFHIDPEKLMQCVRLLMPITMDPAKREAYEYVEGIAAELLRGAAPARQLPDADAAPRGVGPLIVPYGNVPEPLPPDAQGCKECNA